VKTRVAVAAFALMFCSGCGTVMNRWGGEPPRVYGGVRTDCEMIGKGGVPFIIDLPISLVFDTLGLPNDLKSLRNPVKNWKSASLDLDRAEVHRTDGAHKVDRAIVEDCQKFIKEKDAYASEAYFYEDGTGQHAVKLVLEIDYAKWRYYFLLYDKSNVRTKVVKGPKWHTLHF
jgi:uncharacterized protein YceK